MRAYQLWKLQPEYKWLQSLPAAPNAYDRSRLSFRQRWILDDFKIGPGIPLARFEALRSQGRTAAPLITVTPARPEEEKDSPLPPLPPPPRDDNFPDPKELTSVIERLQRDLAAVTQERDQLRAIIQQQQPFSGGARLVVPTAPLPPPAPQTTDKGQVANLLNSIQTFDKKKKLRTAAATTTTTRQKTGLTSTLEQAVLNRRGAIAPKEEDDNEFSNTGAPIQLTEMDPVAAQCQVCYSAGVVQCTACKIATYCGEACQRRHWNAEHEYACIPVSERLSCDL